MANVQLTLTADQAAVLLEMLEQSAANVNQGTQHRVSVREARRELVTQSLRDAMRAAGVQSRRGSVGCCDDRDEK